MQLEGIGGGHDATARQRWRLGCKEGPLGDVIPTWRRHVHLNGAYLKASAEDLNRLKGHRRTTWLRNGHRRLIGCLVGFWRALNNDTLTMSTPTMIEAPPSCRFGVSKLVDMEA